MFPNMNNDGNYHHKTKFAMYASYYGMLRGHKPMNHGSHSADKSKNKEPSEPRMPLPAGTCFRRMVQLQMPEDIGNKYQTKDNMQPHPNF